MKLLGLAMMAAPIVVVFAAASICIGWQATLGAFAAAGVTIACICCGAYLMDQ